MHGLSAAAYAVIGTVAGATIGFAGTAFASLQQARLARRTAREKAVNDALAAADDLLNAISLYRASGGSLFPWTGLGAGVQLALSGLQMTLIPRENWPDLTRRQKTLLTVADLALAIVPGGVASEVLAKTATRYIAIVQPPQQHLSAALAALRLGKSESLAAAADQLATAASGLAGAASSGPRTYRSAERSFKRAARAFRAAAKG